VARVVVVNTTQFKVIRQSVKKTDPHDARALALYLSGLRSGACISNWLDRPMQPQNLLASAFRQRHVPPG